MESGTRAETMTAMLEGHLARCDAALAACAEGRTPNDLLGEWSFKRMLSLMKMSTQLANAIARLDARTSKNRENRGSIQQ